ncbi:MAG: aspartyl/asparaginyl beta-hydroxylase domain-containing protein [Steroidobacteraceae bacterium]|nr:aspartyl/asparaginyl beta-hydroxylase domain-containing protein [Steroidobacteraceae bacterium]
MNTLAEPAATSQAAMRAMAAGDFATAEASLLQVLARDRGNLSAWLNLAAVRRQRQNIDGAFEALREALTIDGRDFRALLMSATMLEQLGQSKQAATAYGVALANAPPDSLLDAPTQAAVRHAREVQARHARDLGDYIRSAASGARSQCTPAERRRLDHFIGITLRVTPRYPQLPLEYYFPGLPPIEFYERAEFPWLGEFEAATPAIQQELRTILAEDAAGFDPYIHYGKHLPLDQWQELNHSPRWSAFHFYRHGERIEDRCRRAPRTIEAIEKLPQAQVPLRSPTAIFSVLKPKTRIPPHTGVANFRLVVHLPLIVPPGCGFRVGSETRQWRIGEAWVFDDTIEHEAWNDSDETRVILICDIWNPRLSADERRAIASVIAATDAYNGTVPAAHV